MQQVNCFDSPDYSTCVAANAAGYDRFSSWALDVNRYADVDSNPYVVGSAAYNAARNLPPPPSWNDRTSEGVRQRALLDRAATQIIASSGAPVGESGTVAAGLGESAVAPELKYLALAAIVLLLLRR